MCTTKSQSSDTGVLCNPNRAETAKTINKKIKFKSKLLQDRIESPEINLCFYGQLMFDKGGSSINGVKIASSTNGVARAG